MNHDITPARSWRPSKVARNIDVCRMYVSGRYTTEHIAKTFGLRRRQVINIARQGGVIRSQADGNRVASPLKPRHRIRHGRAKP